MPPGREYCEKRPCQRRPEMRDQEINDPYERGNRRHRRSTDEHIDGYEEDFSDPRGHGGEFSPERRISRLSLEEARNSLCGVLQTGIKIANPSSNDIRNISDCRVHLRELRKEFRNRFKMIVEIVAVTARGPSGRLDEIENNLAQLDCEYGNIERYLHKAATSLSRTEGLVSKTDRALIRISKPKAAGRAKYGNFDGEGCDHRVPGHDQDGRRLRETGGRSPIREPRRRNRPGSRKEPRTGQTRRERHMPLRPHVDDGVEDPDQHDSYNHDQAEEYEEHLEHSQDQGQEPPPATQG